MRPHPISLYRAGRAGEQLRGADVRSKWCKPGWRRFHKKQRSRRIRRYAKLNPEECPTRVGYWWL